MPDTMGAWDAWLGWTAYRRTGDDKHLGAYRQHERARKRLKAATRVGGTRAPLGTQ